MQRRTLPTLGLVVSALLVLTRSAAAWLQPGLQAGTLAPIGREVFTAVGRVMHDKTLPMDGAERKTALNGLLDRSDVLGSAFLAHQNRHDPSDGGAAALQVRTSLARRLTGR